MNLPEVPPFAALEAVHEDARLVALVKPHGIAVVPGRGPEEGPTFRALAEARFGPLLVVHRLDAGTGGLILFARDAASHRFLSMRFEAGEARKEYLAVCRGTVGSPAALDLPIASRPQAGRYRINFTSGRAARTEFFPVHANESASLVRCVPHTGRTHQIRVHLKALGHPLLVDRLYGASTHERRLPLFASALRIAHPDGGTLELAAPLSDYMKETLAAAGLPDDLPPRPEPDAASPRIF